MFNEGEEEQKPDFLQLISEAFRAGPSPNQPSSSKFTPPPNGSNSPLEARVELSMERSLINLPAALRNDLEERFIEILPNYPCFYDPNDKNFAHNQFKSNSYAEIAKKITADGLETSGPQLAAIFKGIKAKYREEARKMTRLEGRIEPSPFYQRLSFLERGLSTVDQNTLKRIARMRAADRLPVSTAPPQPTRKSYTIHSSSDGPVSAHNMIITPKLTLDIPRQGNNVKIVYGPRVTTPSTHTIITPNAQPVDNANVQSIVERLAQASENEKALVEKLVFSIMTLGENKRENVVARLTQACNGLGVFDNGFLQLMVPEAISDETYINKGGDICKIMKTDDKYRSLTVNFSDIAPGRILVADPRLSDKERRLTNILREEEMIYNRDELDEDQRDSLYRNVAKNMRPFNVDVDWVAETIEKLYRKYVEVKREYSKQCGNAVRPAFLKTLSFMDRSNIIEPSLSEAVQTALRSASRSPTDSPLLLDQSGRNSVEIVEDSLNSMEVDGDSALKPKDFAEMLEAVSKPVSRTFAEAECQTDLVDSENVQKETAVEEPKNDDKAAKNTDDSARNEKLSTESKNDDNLAQKLPENPDIAAISATFAKNPEELAMFRILANQLPTENRFLHIQNLLNIVNATKESSVHISWKTQVYEARKGWTSQVQKLILSGNAANEIPDEPTGNDADMRDVEEVRAFEESASFSTENDFLMENEEATRNKEDLPHDNEEILKKKDSILAGNSKLANGRPKRYKKNGVLTTENGISLPERPRRTLEKASTGAEKLSIASDKAPTVTEEVSNVPEKPVTVAEKTPTVPLNGRTRSPRHIIDRKAKNLDSTRSAASESGRLSAESTGMSTRKHHVSGHKNGVSGQIKNENSSQMIKNGLTSPASSVQHDEDSYEAQNDKNRSCDQKSTTSEVNGIENRPKNCVKDESMIENGQNLKGLASPGQESIKSNQESIKNGQESTENDQNHSKFDQNTTKTTESQASELADESMEPESQSASESEKHEDRQRRIHSRRSEPAKRPDMATRSLRNQALKTVAPHSAEPAKGVKRKAVDEEEFTPNSKKADQPKRRGRPRKYPVELTGTIAKTRFDD
ncbi:unnamed protein product [Bursaphelenchus okinawaensis]|uniref:MADF domain-containing protein n=1 Tax=Bursaphelenchus okinawaensis TaxID=465554 RepID=A0A811LSW9_9BILA|nr:unnamed protein product [Bursaphelenchus okinawaensis]CAG9128488.1 unnamed protein product [Bursaphelenchus okinawaensis]